MKTATLRRSSTAARLLQVVETIPVAAFGLDGEGLPTCFNLLALQLLQRAPVLDDPVDRFLGSFGLLTADGQSIRHADSWMARCLRDGRECSDSDVVVERPDGTRAYVHASATPLFDDDGVLLGTVNVMVDITEHRRTEESLREREVWLSGQGEALEAALNGAPLQTSLGILVRTAIELLGGGVRAAFYLANPEGTALHHVVGMPPGYAEAVDAFPVGPESLSCGLAVHTGRPILTPDVMREPLWNGWIWLAQAYDFRGCWSIPIHTSVRKFTGTLAVYWRESREASDRELEIVTRVSQAAAIIISRHNEREDRRRAEQALRRSESQLQVELRDSRLLQSISAEIVQQENVDGLYQKLVDAASEVMRSDFASMQMLYPERGDGGELRLLGAKGFPPEALQFWQWVRTDSNCTCGIALRTKRRFIEPDVQNSAAMAGTADQAALLENGIRAAQSTPLFSRDGRLLGMITTHWKTPHDPSERDLRLLDVLARQAADLIERKQGEEAEARQAERLRMLWEAAETLLSADDPDAMLRALFAKVGRSLGADVYLNYVVDEEARALRLASCEGIPPRTAREIERLEFGQAVCGTVAQRREPIIASGIQQSAEPMVQLVKSFGIRTYACNPLMAKDTLLGTLSFASRTKDRFDPDELDFLRTICRYVAVAVERLRLLDELKKTDLRKDEFLATLAHELRNPLAPISNAIQLLRIRGADQPELRWSRDVIERQVAHLTRLIDDLLDLSRITRDKLELRRQPVLLADVVAAAAEASRALVEQCGHELLIRLPEDPIPVHGDPVRLAQVFVNLLNNAAKYTNRGGRVWLTAARRGDDAEVSVKDTGVGIPPEKIQRVFDIFYQVDGSLEKSRGGLGIGLSLVRRLVDMHDGKIEARSDGAGKGSEFVVRLPVLADAPLRSSDRGAQDASGAVQGRRILIIDDNRDAADSLAMLLRLAGNEIHTAYDGASGLEVYERLRSDLVLLDIGMPRMNGYDVARRIRATSPGGEVVIIAMTGWGQDADRRRSMDAGFDGHLVKPIDLGSLSDLIASPAAGRRDRRRIGADAAPRPEQAESTSASG